ncbi:MAG: VWA domain-containing protein [bacterium]|nr:VWA domain-containing protein [bacterium]
MLRPIIIALSLTVASSVQATSIFVTITSPKPNEPVFDEVEFSAIVTAAEEIERVEFYVDGQEVGLDETSPYWVSVPLGGDNVERQFTVVAYGVSGAQGTASITTPKLEINLEVEVELQQLYVTVTRDGQRVLDLERENFTVLDNHGREELVTFERGDVPFTAVLLLDASESMKGERLAAATDGARAFLTGLNPLDEAMMILFSDRVLAATPFSNQKAALVTGLEGTRAGGGTALNDHLYAALHLLHRRQGRRTVVLMSDGVDVLSVLGIEDVLWRVRRSDALIYWIRLEDQRQPHSSFSSAWRDFEANREQVKGIEQVVKESGGRVAVLTRLEDLKEAFEGISSELREQYVLGYYPSRQHGDGSWRPVKVRVDEFGTKVRTREGYIDAGRR